LSAKKQRKRLELWVIGVGVGVGVAKAHGRWPMADGYKVFLLLFVHKK
jgi:hypothetical protein